MGKIFNQALYEKFSPELEVRTRNGSDSAEKMKAVKRLIDAMNMEVYWTHRQYEKDEEYIPYEEDVEVFLKREITKPIIRWEDSPQLGYEILPFKYFYHYQPATSAKELLAEFWRLEKEAENTLKELASQ